MDETPHLSPPLPNLDAEGDGLWGWPPKAGGIQMPSLWSLPQTPDPDPKKLTRSWPITKLAAPPLLTTSPTQKAQPVPRISVQGPKYRNTPRAQLTAPSNICVTCGEGKKSDPFPRAHRPRSSRPAPS